MGDGDAGQILSSFFAIELDMAEKPARNAQPFDITSEGMRTRLEARPVLARFGPAYLGSSSTVGRGTVDRS